MDSKAACTTLEPTSFINPNNSRIMANNVPLTIQASKEAHLPSEIVIGNNRLSTRTTTPNLYWVLVLDRADCSVKVNVTFSENDAVPSQLQPYLGNTQYILVLATQMLASNNLPTGKWHDYLVSEGAGVELLRLEHIFAAFNCGTWGRMAYAYVAIMGDSTTDGFESATVQDYTAFLTIDLVPISFGGTTLYTPTSLQASGHQ